MIRGFWKRWTFLLCFVLVSIIVIFRFAERKNTIDDHLTSKFNWILHSSNLTSDTCRNSKQGPFYIADERGYLCQLGDVQANGCCNRKSNSTEQYSCLSCQVNRCCKIYEHCISCCLQPQKRKILELVLRHAHTVKDALLSEVKDTFELCLHKCRTSSASIRQENTYRNIDYKYCYGMDAPSLTHHIPPEG